MANAARLPSLEIAPPHSAKVWVENCAFFSQERAMRHAALSFQQLRPILTALADDGIDVGAVLAKRGFGCDMGAIRDDMALSIVDYFRIQRDIALAADDLTAHFSQRKLTFRTGHFVVSQLQQADTLVGAMERLADHFNMMHGDAYNSVRRSGHRISLVINDSAFPYTFEGDTPLIHFIGDCLLIKIHSLMDSLSSGLAETALRRVRLQRGRDSEGSQQTDFWTVPIDHGWAAYELAYDHDLACRTFPTHGAIDLSTPGFYNRVIEHLARELPSAPPSLAEQTRMLIDDSYTLQEDVARHLGISVATHRRRLEESGLRFRDLVKQSRLGQAEAMLQRGQSVGQVSEALAYSDIRAFNRAFKQWKGVTPAVFLKSLRGAKDTGDA